MTKYDEEQKKKLEQQSNENELLAQQAIEAANKAREQKSATEAAAVVSDAENALGTQQKTMQQPTPTIDVMSSFNNATKGVVEGGGGTSDPTAKNTGAKTMSDLNKSDPEAAAIVDATMQSNQQEERMFSDIMNDYWKQKNREEEEMRRQEQANMYSSMATGATQLAAGIINMYGVGELNASPQQYNNPMADWMKKADADMKANRERRRSMADTMQRLKMQEAEIKAANRLEEAKLLHTFKNEQAEREYRASQMQYKMAKDAQDREDKNAVEAAKLDIQQKQQQETVRHNMANESINRTRVSKIGSGSTKSSGSGSSSSKSSYAAVIDGKPTTLKMSKETYEQGIKTGTEELKQDIGQAALEKLRAAGVDVPEEATVLPFDELVRLSGEKKIRDKNGNKIDNPLYGEDTEIIAALANSGDNAADYGVIERYVKDNKSKVNRFYKHLKSLAESDAEAEEEEVVAEEENKPTGTWEDEFLN